eukprot:CAMPEP_0172376410 /NCGR_PEP_ID=MMETSP1060-20121228/66807_1 /TAXON_ID=37318 /ORGANISM="Pseudo-nitzschia pungens, Strain cf. cingulata" /LENGTH=100 /DNA_ID=CAMNT_0013103927 /DNA_START=302 /DNA_END=604 /DNA_ORIENTATION=-
MADRASTLKQTLLDIKSFRVPIARERIRVRATFGPEIALVMGLTGNDSSRMRHEGLKQYLSVVLGRHRNIGVLGKTAKPSCTYDKFPNWKEMSATNATHL